MGLTTERKVFLALALVAGASLIVDQAVLSPKSVEAASLDSDGVGMLPHEPIIAGIVKPVSRSISDILNDRLSNLDSMKTGSSSDSNVQAEEIQRMFAPLFNANQETDSAPKATNQASQAISVDPVQEIPTNLPSLSAVMPTRSGQSAAIIDALLYQIGESTPAGYRLIEVEQRKVLVEYKARRYWLTLPALAE